MDLVILKLLSGIISDFFTIRLPDEELYINADILHDIRLHDGSPAYFTSALEGKCAACGEVTGILGLLSSSEENPVTLWYVCPVKSCVSLYSLIY